MTDRTISLLSFVLKTATVGLFCLALPIHVWRTGLPFTDLVALLTVLLSWPVTGAIVLVVFLTRFRNAIDQWLRHVEVEGPGGFKFRPQPPADPPPSDPVTESSRGGLTVTDEQRRALVDAIAENQRQREDNLQLALHQWAYWRYSFLNVFLVPVTKQVLLYLASQGDSGVTIGQIRGEVQALGFEPANTDSSLLALIQHTLARVDNQQIRITPDGFRFLQWAGLIPRPPAG